MAGRTLFIVMLEEGSTEDVVSSVEGAIQSLKGVKSVTEVKLEV